MKTTITNLARQHRKNPTKAEAEFWKSVKNRQWEGIKWHRQKPIVHSEIMGEKCFFIADFYCPEYKLIVELDGTIHEDQQEYDKNRTFILKKMGYTVLRFRNEEVFNGTVWEKLKFFLKF